MKKVAACTLLLLLLPLPLAAAGGAHAESQFEKKPNIVWFLTDDQDQMLGSSFPTVGGTAHDPTPLPKTRALMQQQGSMAENFFIHTPICCPSRSELLSGRYFHNLKEVGSPKRDDTCMHINETKVNNFTFAKYLSEGAGYKVGMFGKYLNNFPQGGYVPPGFDAWLANGGGDYIAPEFSTHNAGPGIPNGSWHGTEHNYTTAVVGNLSMAWIEKQVAEDNPFFAYIAPKAAHEPFIPAPWYLDVWDDSWPEHEPRPENWNCSFESRADHHGNIATEPMITDEAATVITGIFKNRWRALLSVDDVISAVISLCDDLGVMNNTYFFYSSDHGFQLGEFNIPMDKRNVYDWNTRIHLLARGPGIKPGTTWSQAATQVDMAPTFLGLAGLAPPPQMDGHSIVPFLVTDPLDPNVAPATRRHLSNLGDISVYNSKWRQAVFIEHYFVAVNTKCMQDCKHPGGDYPHRDSWCTDLANNSACFSNVAGCSKNCYDTEGSANNFIAVRHMPTSPMGDTLYAEFQTGNLQHGPVNFDAVDFVEYYDASDDKWMMHNLHNASGREAEQRQLHEFLHEFYNCAGADCP